MDEVKLSLAISNLVENAVKYNIESGWIKVSLNSDNKYFYVKVADSGVGIPEDAKDKDWLKKRKNEALRTARATYGANKKPVEITPQEWEAIQHRAIGSTNLSKILDNADMDIVRQMATPKRSRGLSDSQISVAKQMRERGYDLTEISQRLGVSPSTVSKAMAK